MNIIRQWRIWRSAVTEHRDVDTWSLVIITIFGVLGIAVVIAVTVLSLREMP